MRSRGLLIVFEGLDKSGKSTQSKLLCEKLNEQNFPSELWRYPERNTSIGKLINSYLCKQIELEDHAVHLLFSANRWETVDLMKQKLNNGVNLIVDRYAYSGVAYTSAKTGFDFDWCKQCDKGLPKPDLVCFMDNKSTCLDTRDTYGEERYERNDFQKVVYENFKKIFNLDSDYLINKDLLVLNAKDTIESLHEAIVKNALVLIKKQQQLNYSPIGTLW